MSDTVTPQRIQAARTALRRHGVMLSEPELKIAIAAADAACWQEISTRPHDFAVIDVWFPQGQLSVTMHSSGNPEEAGATHWALPRLPPAAT